jgi:hypothetical protein
VAGNLAPDGIVGPYRQKEASFYTIRQIWAPLQIEFRDGDLSIRNRYDFTDADRCRLSWELVDFPLPWSAGTGPRRAARGTAEFPSIPPGGRHRHRRLSPADQRRGGDRHCAGQDEVPQYVLCGQIAGTSTQFERSLRRSRFAVPAPHMIWAQRAS